MKNTQVEIQKPSIGRVVHYVLTDDQFPQKIEKNPHRPALIVNAVPNAMIANLTVFLDGMNDGDKKSFSLGSIHYSENHEPGTWHWPEQI